MSNGLIRTVPAPCGTERARAAAALLAVIAAAVLLPPPWTVWTGTSRTAPPARIEGDVEQVLAQLGTAAVAAASLAVWTLLAWVAVVALLTLLARLPGRCGRWATTRLLRVTPRVVQRTLLTGLGVGLVAGLAAPVAGNSAAGPHEPGTAVPVDVSAAQAGPVASVSSAGHRATDRLAAQVALAVAATERADPLPDPALPDPTLPDPTLPDPTARAVGDAVGALQTRTEHARHSWTGHTGTGHTGTGHSWTAVPPAGHDSQSGRGTVPVDVDWPTTVPEAAGTGTPARPPEVVVHRGDTLWSIAARDLGPGATDAAIDAAWHRWYAANRAVIGDDPDLILPGQRLRAPTPADADEQP